MTPVPGQHTLLHNRPCPATDARAANPIPDNFTGRECQPSPSGRGPRSGLIVTGACLARLAGTASTWPLAQMVEQCVCLLLVLSRNLSDLHRKNSVRNP